MKKMTRIEALEIAINNTPNMEAVEVLRKMRAALDKEASRERKPSKTAVENAAKRDEILAWLGTEGHTASEVAEQFGISNQRATALLTPMVEDGRIVREVVKRKAFFKVAA